LILANQFHSRFPLVVLFAVALATLALAGCGGGGGGGGGVAPLVPVANVAVSAPPATPLVLGGTVQLQASLTDSAGNPLGGRAVQWSSSNPRVASVDPASGLVTGVAVGSVVITATSEGVASLPFSIVVPVGSGTPPGPVASVTVDPSTLSLTVGGPSFGLNAVLRDSNGANTNGTVVWSSSAPGMASVDPATGRVTPVGVGKATITATADGHTGMSIVTVSAAPSVSGLPVYVSAFQMLVATHGLPTSVAIYDGDATNCHVRVDTVAVSGATSYHYVVRTPGVADQTIDTSALFIDLVLPVNKRFTVTITAMNGSTVVTTRLSEAFKTVAMKYPAVINSGWLQTQTAANRTNSPVVFTDIGAIGSTTGMDMTTGSANAQTFRIWTAQDDAGTTGVNLNGWFRIGIEYFDRFIPGLGNMFSGAPLGVTLNFVAPSWKLKGDQDNSRQAWWLFNKGVVTPKP